MHTEWAWTPHPEGHHMPLGDRIRDLRKEHGWSQADLATRAGADSQRISRYETGKLTPSIPALIRLAQALNVTIDHLVIDGAPRQPLTPTDHDTAQRLHQLHQLDPTDRQAINTILDGLITKNRVRNAITQAS